ncbi:MAG: preprotein translocase subunit Sec61beta [Nanoarchaeota archaeon]|nr:preprotein translocase subunit Sec61beta [Nanoarchaeota archaeon]
MAEKINMPSGMGGLVRYFDDYKSKITLKPEIIIGLVVLVMIVEFLLHNL